MRTSAAVVVACINKPDNVNLHNLRFFNLRPDKDHVKVHKPDHLNMQTILPMPLGLLPYLWVLYKSFQTVNKVCAVEGVATNANNSRLPQPFLAGLEHCLICQCARTGYDADLSWLVDVALQVQE